jgi:NitT/TauT family transport system substrate-binding protein
VVLQGHIAATDYLNTNAEEAQQVVNGGIAKVTGQALPYASVGAAWKNMSFTLDPVSASLRKDVTDAQAAGLLDSKVKIDGIYDLSILNKLLTAAGCPAVKD